MLNMQDEREIKKVIKAMFDAELYGMEQNEKLREPATFSGKFEKRMAGLIRRQRLRYQVKTAVKYMLSAAAVLLIVSCLTNPGRAAKAWNALVKWYRYPKHVELHVNMPEEEKGKEIPEYELTYIPEGFMEGLSNYNGTEGYVQYFGEGYVQNADSLTQKSITLAYSSSDARVYYQEDKAVREKDEEGNEVFCIREEGDIRLVWYSEKDKLMFRLLTSGLPREEAYRIKDGIRRKEDAEYKISPEKAKWEVPVSCRKKVNENLSFDAEVISADSFQNGIFYRTKGYYQEYDEDAFLELFFTDKTIEDRYTYYLPDRSGEEKEGYAYQSSDGCSICLYPTDAIYSVAAEQDYYFYSFCDIMGNLTMYNADQYSKTKELKFMTREESRQKVRETLDNMGFSTGDLIYQAYALDASTLCEESERVYEWGFTEGEVDFRTEWDESQEAYAFQMWQACQGLPVWTALISPVDVVDESKAPVTGIYREDGYAVFHVTDILDFERSEEYDALLPFENIVQLISDKYSGLITEDKIIITEMRLCALTVRDGQGSCMIMPVWICTGKLEEGGNLEQMVFNAVTGEEIYAN